MKMRKITMTLLLPNSSGNCRLRKNSDKFEALLCPIPKCVMSGGLPDVLAALLFVKELILLLGRQSNARHLDGGVGGARGRMRLAMITGWFPLYFVILVSQQ